jgi:hypothetical protein
MTNGLLNIFDSNLRDPRKRSLNAGLLNAAGSLLADSGYSRVPVTTGQSIGKALLAYKSGLDSQKKSDEDRDYRKQVIDLKKRQLESGLANPGGSTNYVVQQIMKDNPDMSYTDALYQYQTGWRQGMRRGKDGIEEMPGYADTKRDFKYSEKAGEKEAELDYVADIEREKREGRGEVSPMEKVKKGKGQVSGLLDELKKRYEELDKEGGIVNTDRDFISNIGSRVASSGFGQGVGRALGTKEQSIRNKIEQTRPLLLNAIRQATEMGARGLDSEKELEFYLKAATDPSIDIDSNLNALRVLDRAYGLGMGMGDVGKEPEGLDLKSMSTEDLLRMLDE